MILQQRIPHQFFEQTVNINKIDESLKKLNDDL